jgi:hypothetical protein
VNSAANARRAAAEAVRAQSRALRAEARALRIQADELRTCSAIIRARTMAALDPSAASSAPAATLHPDEESIYVPRMISISARAGDRSRLTRRSGEGDAGG